MIRKAVQEDAMAISKVRIDSWRTTYEGIVDQSYLEKMRPEKWADRWSAGLNREDFITYVAETEGDILGFAIAGREREKKYKDYQYEIWAIYVLKEHQRKGIGQLLVSKMIEILSVEGDSGLIIWALDENPYTSFYKKLGGVPINNQFFEIEGKKHRESAYAWDSLRDIQL
ncbi:N-acetyltransferase [Jeotgalibacillus sp. S-D1]|uniref:GNAT family N-acetyltransferase n=1 Tax=Jeotgalibacillus sp. S-D1 TaxID=2552189 RepID=UPI0010596300|nr:GNAT family N-acetyltransferase [Jeotgalibacillus sp. S-D1]TDL31350.1 N-acetyltransferase [Jeotgalibacillus sp. S-D1]